MRVIAGSAGGIRLKIPPHNLRPTMDMVREAAFSALADLVVGARVLDLFAGSGAYGIEALSRGAAEAVFVDDHPKSIESIRFNLSRTKLDGKVIRDDVEIDPPDATVVYGAFWYKSPLHEEARISCFVLMLRADDTWVDVPKAHGSYRRTT